MAAKHGPNSQPLNGGRTSQPIQVPPIAPDQVVGGFRAATPTPTASAPQAASFSPSTMGAGSRYSRNAAQYSNRKRRMGTGKKVAIALCIVLVLMLGGAGTAAALYYNSLNNAIQISDPTEAAEVKEVLAPTVSDQPFYIMLIGSDTRNDDEGARSDTNIVARVDLAKKTVTMISIPRDTAITLDGYGTQKFNAAYNYEGASGAISAANDLLGIHISHYAEVDFWGVIDLVDALGGVEVDVPMEITDYDAGGHVDAGLQTLDGDHALIFARSRSYVSGDFQRTTNQRILIEAIISKIMTLPPTELPGIVQKMASFVSTDMSMNDIVGYASAFRDDAGDLTMYSTMLPASTAELDGVSYVVCDTTTLTKMMKAVNAGEDPAPYVTNDTTVSSSEQAQEEGAESTVNYGDGGTSGY